VCQPSGQAEDVVKAGAPVALPPQTRVMLPLPPGSGKLMQPEA